MSRSYKKNPIVKDNGNTKKIGKKLANHKVRSYLKDEDNVLSNSDYQKVYEKYDICDYTSRMTKEQWKENYYLFQNSPNEYERKRVEGLTLKQWMRIWHRRYRRK